MKLLISKQEKEILNSKIMDTKYLDIRHSLQDVLSTDEIDDQQLNFLSEWIINYEISESLANSFATCFHLPKFSCLAALMAVIRNSGNSFFAKDAIRSIDGFI